VTRARTPKAAAANQVLRENLNFSSKNREPHPARPVKRNEEQKEGKEDQGKYPEDRGLRGSVDDLKEPLIPTEKGNAVPRIPGMEQKERKRGK